MECRKIIGMFFLAIMLGLILFMVIFNFAEVDTVDISGVKSQQIVAGSNPVKDCEELSPIQFAAKDYEFVMVGVESVFTDEITYLGMLDGQYYKTTEEVDCGNLQAVEDVRLDGQTLIITYKEANTVLFCILAAIFIGGIGLVIAFGDE